MKRLLIFPFVWLLMQECLAQELKQLYIQKDLFKLKAAYEKKKRQLPKQEILFYQAILKNAFNQPEKSNQTIHVLEKAGYLKLLSDSLKKDLLYIKADNFIKLYQYKEAVACYDTLLSRYGATHDSSGIEDLKNSRAMWGAISDISPQEVVRHRTASFGWKKDKIGLITVPVVYRQDTCDLVFDTGANLSVITESSAKKLGMKTIEVDFQLASGTTGKSVKSMLAVADSLQFGGILIRHAIFLLLPDEMLNFKQVQYSQQGIIGWPIMNQLDEVRISGDGGFTVPAVPARKSFQNLAMDGLMPIADFGYQGDSHPFRFDTGASTSILYEPFFEKYKDMVVTKGKPYKMRTGGVGGTILESDAYTINKVPFDVSGNLFTIPKINVRTTSVGSEKDRFYGNMGLDMFGKYQMIVINFRDMYLEVK